MQMDFKNFWKIRRTREIMIKRSRIIKVENLKNEPGTSARTGIIGGMLWVKMSDANVQTAIDLSGLGLDQIEETEEEFRIGQMVTLVRMELHEGLSHYTEGAVERRISTYCRRQFRNLAQSEEVCSADLDSQMCLTLLLALDCRECGALQRRNYVHSGVW